MIGGRGQTSSSKTRLSQIYKSAEVDEALKG
jgi:hypothetical protein